MGVRSLISLTVAFSVFDFIIMKYPPEKYK